SPTKITHELTLLTSETLSLVISRFWEISCRAIGKTSGSSRNVQTGAESLALPTNTNRDNESVSRQEIDMRQELDDALVRDFPNLYAGRNSDKSPFCWGFECGDGWEPLIRKLSEELEAIIVAMPEKERKKFKAVQVKEKFGTLRFYMGIAHDGIHA